MSDAGPVYDPVELRRRIVVCFSVGELKALAESLGVGGIAWERGIQEAAREVVRQSERYAGLPALVAKLREIRPLVEWPEAAPSAAAPAGAPLPTLVSAAAPPPTDAPVPAGMPGPPTLSASPGTLGPPVLGPPPAPSPAAAPSSPPLADPYAPPPGPPVIQAPPPAGGPWPGVVEQKPATPPAGVDPRIFIVVAGLMVVAAIVAYVAGRASSAPAQSDASPAADTSAAPATARTDGPAALAAGMLARSFADLARVCELPSSAGSSALVFHRVYERCGPGAPARRPYSPPPITTPAASAEPAATAEPGAPRNRRPGRGGDAPPGEAPNAAKGCMGACEATHSACSARCGAVPTESGAYDTFQRSQGRCLSEASRCRLNCH